MSKVKVYNFKGEAVKDIELSDEVFGLNSNDSLVHQVFVSMMSNQRQPIAHTKNVGERAGSGKKPWKQKGTGRARVGSIRNSIWRKGGIVFGPTSDRNFEKKINKKANLKAIKIVLSEKVKSGSLIIFEKIELQEKKTKEIHQALKNVGIAGSTLLGLADSEKEAYLYSRNIEKVDVLPTSALNVMDMMNSKNLVLSLDSINYLEEKYKK